MLFLYLEIITGQTLIFGFSRSAGDLQQLHYSIEETMNRLETGRFIVVDSSQIATIFRSDIPEIYDLRL